MICVEELIDTSGGRQSNKTGIGVAPGYLDPLRDQGAVQSHKRNDIADCTQSHEIQPAEQIRLGESAAVATSLPERAVYRDNEQKGHTYGGQLAVPTALVEPVRIDDRGGARQQRLGDVMIDNDHLKPGIGGLGQWQMSRCTAIDGDDYPHTFIPQAQQRWGVRTVTLVQPVWHVDPCPGSDGREEPRQQRRGGGPVDVVIAEDADRLAVARRTHEPRGSNFHIAQMRRIRELLAKTWGKKTGRLVQIDAALRKQPADDVGQSQSLGDRLPDAVVPIAHSPAA